MRTITYVNSILFVLLNTSSKILLKLGNSGKIIDIANQGTGESELLSLSVLDLWVIACSAIYDFGS